MSDRQHYVGKPLAELRDAVLGLSNLCFNLNGEAVAHRRRVEAGRIAEHADVTAALDTAIDEVEAAIAVVVDVIESGDSRESMEEQADINRLAAATRERQLR